MNNPLPEPENAMNLDSAAEALMGSMSDGIFGDGGLPDNESDEPEATDEAPEAVETAPDDEPEAPETETADPEVDEATTPEDTFKTDAELAEALGMSLDDFASTIKTKVKIDGVEQEVTLAEARAGYQRQQDYSKKTAEAAQERRAIAQERAKIEQSLANFHTEFQTHLGTVYQHLDAQLNSPEMQEMQLYERERWASEHYAITQQKLALAQKAEADRQQYLQHQQQTFAQQRQEAAERLRETIPDWGPEAGQAAIQALQQFGFTPDEMSRVTDHRFVQVAHELAQAKAELATLRTQATTGKAVADKVKKKVPLKVAAPAKPTTQRQKLAAANARKHKQFQQTGSIEDAAALLFDKIS